jgi:hypothetical protein
MRPGVAALPGSALHEGMTSRSLFTVVALAAAIALSACEKRGAPAGGDPPEPKMAEKEATPPVEPPPVDEVAPPRPDPASAPDAGSAAPAEREPSKGEPSEDEPSKGEPSKDEPSKDEPSKDEPGGADGKTASCGGIAGSQCKKGEKCRYSGGKSAPPHPDAMGTCVGETYCEVPADCEGLMHVMVPGQWACAANTCAWKSEGGSGPQ